MIDELVSFLNRGSSRDTDIGDLLNGAVIGSMFVFGILYVANVQGLRDWVDKRVKIGV